MQFPIFKLTFLIFELPVNVEQSPRFNKGHNTPRDRSHHRRPDYRITRYRGRESKRAGTIGTWLGQWFRRRYCTKNSKERYHLKARQSGEPLTTAHNRVKASPLPCEQHPLVLLTGKAEHITRELRRIDKSISFALSQCHGLVSLYFLGRDRIIAVPANQCR